MDCLESSQHLLKHLLVARDDGDESVRDEGRVVNLLPPVPKPRGRVIGARVEKILAKDEHAQNLLAVKEALKDAEGEIIEAKEEEIDENRVESPVGANGSSFVLVIKLLEKDLGANGSVLHHETSRYSHLQVYGTAVFRRRLAPRIRPQSPEAGSSVSNVHTKPPQLTSLSSM